MISSMFGWGPARSQRVGARTPVKRLATEEITINGVRIELLRKEIKNLHLSVLPPDGRVRVSVPMRLPIERVISAIEARFEWILTQRLRLAATAEPELFLDGDFVPLWGVPHVIELVRGNGKAKACVAALGVIELTVGSGSTAEVRRTLVEGLYRQQLKSQAAPLLLKWEYALGVKASELRVRKMTTRWGSCNVAVGRIWLNLELARRPQECLEYVVVHELTHLLEAGHGPRFSAHMDRALPNWRDRKRQLNEG